VPGISNFDLVPNLLPFAAASRLPLAQELHRALEQLRVCTGQYPPCATWKTALRHGAALPSGVPNAATPRTIPPIKGIGNAFNFSCFSHNSSPVNDSCRLLLRCFGVCTCLYCALKPSREQAHGKLLLKAERGESPSTDTANQRCPRDAPGRQAGNVQQTLCKKAKQKAWEHSFSHRHLSRKLFIILLSSQNLLLDANWY